MVALLILAMVLTAPAEPLPPLEAETLIGEKVRLPELWTGQGAVVLWSFSREAGEGVRLWMAELEAQGVEAWGVAVLQRAPRFVRPMIRRGMRGDFPKAAHGRVLCLYSGEAELRRALGITDDRLPLVVVFDAGGAPAWSYAGPPSAAAREQLLAHRPQRP